LVSLQRPNYYIQPIPRTLKTRLMCQRQASFEMNSSGIPRFRPNNRLTNASIDSVKHHCKHSKVRKHTKTLYNKEHVYPDDFISELNKALNIHTIVYSYHHA